MPLPILDTILNAANTVLDRVIPDPEQREKAKLEMRQLAQAGELQELEVRMSAILAEANSSDPWTSRARPSFLYVMYVFFLASIPLGIVSVFAPDGAAQIAAGAGAWLDAIPEAMWAVFGVGYTGYAAARSIDKRTRAKYDEDARSRIGW